MKIKLAILERDKVYLMRMVSTFGTKYGEHLEIYSFTDPEVALETLNTARINMLLASDAFSIDVSRLPNRCAFAYLVDAVGVDTVNGQRAIGKFQKADLIYKQILSAYSEKATSITGFCQSDEEGKILMFSSPSGGVGNSTMAASCAMYLARQGRKVLYLNLETFGSADLFFSGEGQSDMSDIIFALKSRKANLPLKLESCVKRDKSGVCFFSQTRIALDRMEMTTEDTLQLLSELKLTGGYDYIVADLDFGLDRDMLSIYRQAAAIIMVGDGSMESNRKTERAYVALSTLEAEADVPLNNRVAYLYNRVSSKNGVTIQAPGLKVLGGAPRYSGGSTRQVMELLAATDLFDTVVRE